MFKKFVYVTLFFMSLSLIAFETNFSPKEVKANDETIIETAAINIGQVTTLTTGVGRTINLVKHENVDYNQIKYDNPIFDLDWLSTQTKIKININQVTNQISHENSFENIVADFEEKANYSGSISLGSSIFSATADAKFYDENMNYSDYTYQYYSSYSKKIELYSYELPNVHANTALYRRYLGDDYYFDCEDFLNGDLDRNTFFDRYGTHLVAKAVFGGSFDINYSMASNRYDVWDELFDPLASYINNSLYYQVGTSSSINFDPFNNFSFSTSRAIQRLSFTVRGGSNSIEIQHAQEIPTAFNTWSSSVSSSPKIIKIPSNGLIPLWEFLPVPYYNTEYKNYFIEQYMLYANAYEEILLDVYTPSIFDITDGVETGFSMLRYGERTITGDSQFDQDYDYVDLNQRFDLKFDYMRAHGYNSIDIYLQFEMKEIYMGYQLIYFYYSEKESDDYLIQDFEYELDGAILGNEYTPVGFVRFSVPISTFINNDPDDYAKIVFRYSARGALMNYWANKEIYCNVVYFKE